MVDASQLLSIAQLDALRELPIVDQSMSNPAIREMLTKIDSSGNRMKELEKALLDRTFASFMYQALDAVDAK
uniref:Uncharacterized protein n=1 Tax=Globisporangium ultimum (strain ATCC 200006 / CBS 805.95 / DAOM BR144) TaxID=431595 RepID=K3X7I8_GLOUD